jgi:hypothetical protein
MTTPIASSTRKRPRRERLIAALAFPLLAFALIAGSAGAASAATPASSTYRFLCTYINNSLCAIAAGSGNYVQMEGATEPPHNTTNWYYPTGTGYTTIRQANTQLCMQLDHDASNRVIEATCNTASYQEWDLTSNSEFRSEWDTSLCLTTPFPGGPLYASTCTAGSEYQIFHALT